jgi:hypothetical protein
MEIRVNKDAQEKLHQQELQSVLNYAQSVANQGKEYFYHTKHKANGLSSWGLIQMVEEATNDTVYGGYKCISDDSIKFSIKN